MDIMGPFATGMVLGLFLASAIGWWSEPPTLRIYWRAWRYSRALKRRQDEELIEWAQSLVVRP